MQYECSEAWISANTAVRFHQRQSIFVIRSKATIRSLPAYGLCLNIVVFFKCMTSLFVLDDMLEPCLPWPVRFVYTPYELGSIQQNWKLEVQYLAGIWSETNQNLIVFSLNMIGNERIIPKRCLLY